MYYSYLTTPIGELLLAGDDDALCVVGFPSVDTSDGSQRRAPEPDWIYSDQALEDARDQLQAYFDGSLHKFDLQLRPGGTEFQQKVLNELQRIPYGTTASYADIARRIGKPKAMRAVGAANGRNPLPIVIPCHRVIGSNGTLTGFGGGLPMKEALLRLEFEHSRFPHAGHQLELN